MSVFLGLPNDLFLAVTSVTGTAAAVITIWCIYYAKRHEKRALHRAVATKALSLFKGLSIATLILASIILTRLDVDYRGSFFDSASLNKSWWCAVRVIIASVYVASVFMFDAHAFFRIYIVLSLPLFTTICMMSQIDFAKEVACVEKGVCAESETGSRRSLVGLAFVDLATIFCLVFGSVLSLWLAARFGFRANNISFQRQEHRELRALTAADGAGAGGAVADDDYDEDNDRL